MTIGDNGVSASVLKEILLNLAAHELIKIKIRKDDKKERESIANEICGSTNALLVQQIGKVLVLYLHNPEKKNNISL